jgi:8-oxo-dGTP diphosphatase
MNQMIYVTCAIIERDGKILATQRSDSMSLPLKWEFPGGKLELNETEEACIVREIEEELGIGVLPFKKLPSSSFDYPSKSITLVPFMCKFESGTITLKEHSSFLWLLPSELEKLDWAEADIPVLKYFLREFCNSEPPIV